MSASWSRSQNRRHAATGRDDRCHPRLATAHRSAPPTRCRPAPSRRAGPLAQSQHPHATVRRGGASGPPPSKRRQRAGVARRLWAHLGRSARRPRRPARSRQRVVRSRRLGFDVGTAVDARGSYVARTYRRVTRTWRSSGQLLQTCHSLGARSGHRGRRRGSPDGCRTAQDGRAKTRRHAHCRRAPTGARCEPSTSGIDSSAIPVCDSLVPDCPVSSGPGARSALRMVAAPPREREQVRLQVVADRAGSKRTGDSRNRPAKQVRRVLRSRRRGAGEATSCASGEVRGWPRVTLSALLGFQYVYRAEAYQRLSRGCRLLLRAKARARSPQGGGP